MLRDATDADLGTIRSWRNHPRVRQVSFSTHEIGEAEHRSWWARVAADPDRRVLIFEQDGRPAGVVSVDLDPADRASAEWGFFLDLDGLAGREQLAAWLNLEREALRYAFDELKVDRLGGATLAENTQVLRLHQRFGFTEARRYPREVDGVPREVVWTELRAETYRAGQRRTGSRRAR